MAQGDIIADITDLAADSWYTVQPAAGESYLIDDFFSSGDGTNAGKGRYYDGTDGSPDFPTSTSDLDFVSYRATQSKTHQETMFHINNTLYWRVYNDGGVAARKCGVLAIQLK